MSEVCMLNRLQGILLPILRPLVTLSPEPVFLGGHSMMKTCSLLSIFVMRSVFGIFTNIAFSINLTHKQTMIKLLAHVLDHVTEHVL
jgi:hypothetical protein